MLNYEILNLQCVAKSLLVEKTEEYIPDETKNNEALWNESLFISQILLHSTRGVHLNSAVLDEGIKKYNDKKRFSVDKTVLEKNLWIRHVCDEIRIPSQTFLFCRNLYNDHKEREKYKNHQYFNELLFLGYLADKYTDKDSKPYRIDVSDFDKTYNKFKGFYPNILSKCKIKELLRIKKIKNSCQYKYSLSYIRNFSYSKRILANVWNYISNENTVPLECIKKWILIFEEFRGADFIEFMDNEEEQVFSDAALQLLLQEKDLLFEDESSENKKLICDWPLFAHLKKDLFLNGKKSNLNIKYSDYFLLLCSYRELYPRSELSEFLAQSCRVLYRLPVESLLYTKQYGEYIRDLLSPKEKRPFLFLQILYFLENRHPEYLLNFIDEDDYGMAFYATFIKSCFHKIISGNELLVTSTISLLKKSIQLFVDKNFKSRPFRHKTFSRILMWLCGFNAKIERTPTATQIKTEIYDYHIQLLQEAFLTQKQELKSHLFIDYFNEEKDYILPIRHGIGCISHFSYFFNILDLAKQQNDKEFILLIVEEIKKIYKKNILENNNLFLAFEYSQIESFDWRTFYTAIIDRQEIEEFRDQTLGSFITVESSDLKSSNSNHTNADRYKLLLKTLCLAYKKSCLDYKDFLEKVILELLSHCFIDDLESKKIDIFATSYESSYIENLNTSLFPLLVEVVNSFTKNGQEKFINLVLTEGDFRLLFKAYNLITFEEGKKQIEDFIKGSDFSSKIDEIYTIPDLIRVLGNVANSRLDENFEKILFDELDKNIAKKASRGNINEYAYHAELLRLFRLFKERNSEALLNYKFPYEDLSVRFLEYRNLLDSKRNFYLALIELKKEKYNDSYCKLENLTKQYPDNLEYKIYKLYAKTFNLSQKANGEEIKSLISETSELLTNSQSLRIYDTCKDVLLITKLRLYKAENDLDKALYFYQILEPTLQRDLETSYLMVKLLLKNNKPDEAIKIYENIYPKFHEYDDYKELTKLLPMDKMVSELSNSYIRILGLSDEKRFEVLPGKINIHNRDIGVYVLYEIQRALNNTLKKKDLLDKIYEKKLAEDNITDLLELEIESRISMLGYELKNQNRSGKSSTGKNAGEVDLEIKFNDFSIIIEAVKYSCGPADRKKHIEKIFNYDPSRRYFYNLIYFDSGKNFDDSWDRVKKDIESAKYPSGYERIETKEMDSDNSSIKIAVSKHNGGLTYYHVMGNFCYAFSKKQSSVRCRTAKQAKQK